MKDKMVLALNHFKADETSNSNSISNAWNLLFMIVSRVKLYHIKSIVHIIRRVGFLFI